MNKRILNKKIIVILSSTIGVAICILLVVLATNANKFAITEWLDDVLGNKQDAYEGWLTYENEEYGFSFKYPVKYTVTINEKRNLTGGLVIQISEASGIPLGQQPIATIHISQRFEQVLPFFPSKSESFNEFYSEIRAIKASDPTSYPSVYGEQGYVVTKSDEKILSDISAYKLLIETGEDAHTEKYIYHVWYLFNLNGGMIFQIHLNESDAVEIVDSIISTFSKN